MTDGWLVSVVETLNVTVSPQFGEPLPFASETMTRLRLEGSLFPPLSAEAVGAKATTNRAIETTTMLRRRFMAARLPFRFRERLDDPSDAWTREWVSPGLHRASTPDE